MPPLLHLHLLLLLTSSLPSRSPGNGSLPFSSTGNGCQGRKHLLPVLGASVEWSFGTWICKGDETCNFSHSQLNRHLAADVPSLLGGCLPTVAQHMLLQHGRHARGIQLQPLTTTNQNGTFSSHAMGTTSCFLVPFTACSSFLDGIARPPAPAKELADILGPRRSLSGPLCWWGPAAAVCRASGIRV